jgi:CTP:molybdopterin cytidylyltransferase MocA
VKPALVVPAAGASRRLGECKATVELGGRAAILHLLESAACLDEHAPLVVVGPDAERIEACLPPGVECLRNPDWEAGRTGGIALAARARAGLDLVLAPVDCPLVPPCVFRELLEAWTAAGAPRRGWLSPRHARTDGLSRHGHPLFLGRELAATCGILAPGDSLRLLRDRADPRIGLDVSAVEVLDRLDEPSDLERLRRRLSESISSPPTSGLGGRTTEKDA